MKLLLAIIGWSGSFLIVAAYFLNVFGVITPQDVIFPTMNLLGALFLGIEYTRKKAYPGTVLEIVWGAIALANFATIF